MKKSKSLSADDQVFIDAAWLVHAGATPGSPPFKEGGHRGLLRYMMGWKKGAAGLAFGDEEMKEPDFKAGWDAGRKSVQDAYSQACGDYKAELDPLRIQ